MASVSVIHSSGTKTKTTTASSTTTQNKSADLSLIRGVVSDIQGFKAKGLEYDALAAAQDEKAAGYDAEIASYGSSEKLATLYAAYSKAIGDIDTIQARQKTLTAIGEQSAGLAGAGFSDSADIVRSSLQRGYLQDQIVRTQSLYDQAGYLEQASASKAQSSAAGVAKTAALNTKQTYIDAADQARTYATNATTGLSGYLSKFNTTTTAEGLLSGEDIGTDIATSPRVTSTTTTGATDTSAPVGDYSNVSPNTPGWDAIRKTLPADSFSDYATDTKKIVGTYKNSPGTLIE